MGGDGKAQRLGAAMAVCVLAAPPAFAQAPPAPPDPSLPGVTVTATRLDEARGSIQPSLGAARYDFTPSVIDTVPQGGQAPINEVLLRAPGVAADSFGQLHARGDRGNLQCRPDSVRLPEVVSLFN